MTPPDCEPGSNAMSIEGATDRAWPSEQRGSMGSWQLRWSPSTENRPRSTLPWPERSRFSIVARVDAVERFYAQFGEPARFQFIPGVIPREVETSLIERRYFRSDPSLVMVASLPTRVPEYTVNSVRSDVDHDLDAWIDRWAAIRENSSVTRRQLEGLRFLTEPAAYASLSAEGEAVGLGRAVLAGNWLGLFNIFTVPHARLRGVGSAVATELAKWGFGQGARRAYLQVELANEGGQRLYRALGFDVAYRYYYLIQPNA